MGEIEQLLRQHKASGTRWTHTADLIRFEFTWPYEVVELGFRIDLHIPARTQDKRWALSERDREKESRRLMRVLLYHVKAKLVAVEDGLVDLEREFLPYLITAGGTAGDELLVEMKAAALEERLPAVKLLPEGTYRKAPTGGSD